MLQKKEIAGVLFALFMFCVGLTRGEGPSDQSWENVSSSYRALREKLEGVVNKWVEQSAANSSDPVLLSLVKEAGGLSEAKVTTVIEAINQNVFTVGDHLPKFAEFFGPDFPDSSDYIVGEKSTWIKLDLFPNRLFKEVKHIPVGWTMWIEFGSEQKLLSYFLTDQRKLNIQVSAKP